MDLLGGVVVVLVKEQFRHLSISWLEVKYTPYFRGKNNCILFNGLITNVQQKLVSYVL